MTLHQKNFVIAQELLLTPYGLQVSDLDRVFTEINAHKADDADVYFPQFAQDQWCITQQTHHPADATHAFAFTCVDYARR